MEKEKDYSVVGGIKFYTIRPNTTPKGRMLFDDRHLDMAKPYKWTYTVTSRKRNSDYVRIEGDTIPLLTDDDCDLVGANDRFEALMLRDDTHDVTISRDCPNGIDRKLVASYVKEV